MKNIAIIRNNKHQKAMYQALLKWKIGKPRCGHAVFISPSDLQLIEEAIMESRYLYWGNVKSEVKIKPEEKLVKLEDFVKAFN